MKKLNTQLFVLLQLLLDIQKATYLLNEYKVNGTLPTASLFPEKQDQDKAVERIKCRSEGKLSLQFISVSPDQALSVFVELLKNQVMDWVEVIELKHSPDDKLRIIEKEKITRNDLKKSPPPRISAESESIWELGCETDMVRLKEAIEACLERWHSHKHLWRPERQMEAVTELILAAAENFSRDHTKIEFKPIEYPHIDFVAVLLTLQKFGKCNIRSAMPIFDHRYKAIGLTVTLSLNESLLQDLSHAKLFTVNDHTVAYDDKQFALPAGYKLAFLHFMAERKAYSKAATGFVEDYVWGGAQRGTQLKSLIAKVNADFRKSFGVERAFSLKSAYVHRNF